MTLNILLVKILVYEFTVFIHMGFSISQFSVIKYDK